MTETMAEARETDALRDAARAYLEASREMAKAFDTPQFQAACAAFQRAEQALQAMIAADLEAVDDATR